MENASESRLAGKLLRISFLERMSASKTVTALQRHERHNGKTQDPTETQVLVLAQVVPHAHCALCHLAVVLKVRSFFLSSFLRICNFMKTGNAFSRYNPFNLESMSASISL